MSPDGKFYAHAVENRVEIISMIIDPEEGEYRLFHTRLNERRYTEEYASAQKSKDTFAARFYFDRILSLPDQRTTARFTERNNALPADPLVIARTGFHHEISRQRDLRSPRRNS